MNMKLKFTKYMAARCLFFGFLLLLTGCGNEEEPQLSPSITFNSEVEESHSRAPMVDNWADEDFVTFSVWGNYKEGSTTTAVFTNQLVTRTNGVWGYSPAKTWVLTATGYDFSACSPHDAGTPAVTDNDLTSITFDSYDNQVDLMMARTTVDPEDFKNDVKLTFSHALAAVSFTFLLKEGFNYVNTYKVTQVELSDLHTTGKFTLNADKTISAQTTGEPGTAKAITVFTGSTFTKTTSMVSDPLFVIPQTGTAKVTISIQISNQSITLPAKDLTMDWQVGKRYNYQVAIDPLQGVTISVQTTPWTELEIQEIVVGGTN